MPSSRSCSAWHHHLQAGQRGALGLQALPARRPPWPAPRRGPGRRRSTSAWRSARTRRRSASPATRTSSSCAAPDHGRAALVQRPPGRERPPRSSGSDPASRSCSAVTAASRCPRPRPRPGRAVVELAGQPAPAPRSAGRRVGPRRLGREAWRSRARSAAARASRAAAERDPALGQVGPGQRRRPPPPRRPAAAPLRPRPR